MSYFERFENSVNGILSEIFALGSLSSISETFNNDAYVKFIINSILNGIISFLVAFSDIYFIFLSIYIKDE